MKGIYISVPDNELGFYLTVLERFKTATVLRTDELKPQDTATDLLPWQLTELEDILKEEKATTSTQYVESSQFLSDLRKEFSL
jgi:uncharacterized membrane protein YdfJ with MMPL/SSD domain